MRHTLGRPQQSWQQDRTTADHLTALLLQKRFLQYVQADQRPNSDKARLITSDILRSAMLISHANPFALSEDQQHVNLL